MQKLSFNNISIVSLALTTASAIAAAILPSKSDTNHRQENTANNGRLVANSNEGFGVGDGFFTCIQILSAPIDCHYTAASGNSSVKPGPNDFTSLEAGWPDLGTLQRQTIGNTSITNINNNGGTNPIDTTSQPGLRS
ncbi:MAG: hypothetical protein P0Y53_23480 [Candidatus Pseudobacter hemicellulosilyticus]|uniref:Uncharacterized protein n=1 Tax=Candidatus Pseudobacter hemicellulosilyticus TaxID=3121375 RepID=A0AAJ6BFB5_9BACT|nr:MAG: hypothetical protein P0Y53_23480 [Pseudobacter sp.]